MPMPVWSMTDESCADGRDSSARGVPSISLRAIQLREHHPVRERESSMAMSVASSERAPTASPPCDMPRASHGACSSRTSSNRSGTRGVGAWLPDGIDVKVVENADDCVYITLPAAPAGALDLSDDELNNAAGGTSILDGWDMIEAQNL